MVSAQKAIHLIKILNENSIRLWVCGGWGVDALLGEHTRPHHDLDVILLASDVTRLLSLLPQEGFTLKDYWEENRWIIHDGEHIPTAFYLSDADGDEFDAHALYLDEQGNGIPAWDVTEGFILTWEDLDGEGTIAGVKVPCFTPEMQMRVHSGYELPDRQIPDLEGLHRKFGLPYPKEYLYRKQSSIVNRKS